MTLAGNAGQPAHAPATGQHARNTASRLTPVPGAALAVARWPAADPCNGRCLSSVRGKRAPEAGQRHAGFPCLAFNFPSCGVVFNVWRCSVAAHQVRAGIIRKKAISDGLAQFSGYVGHGVFQCRGRVKGRPGSRSARRRPGEDWGEAEPLTLNRSGRRSSGGVLGFKAEGRPLHPCHVANAGCGAAPHGVQAWAGAGC